jgi:hypothetical protein
MMAERTSLERKSVGASEKITLPKRFEPRFWKDADHRHHKVRLIKRRCAALAQDTGADSAQKELLCQRAAFISVVLETMEVLLAEGREGFDLGAYTQATNTLTGLLKTLGLDRHVKNVTDLKTYLAEKNA